MYEALPKRLATLRKSKGFSQEELANALGVSRQAVSKWERGESSPDTLNLIGLADLYEMSLDELVRGEAYQSEAAGTDVESEAITPTTPDGQTPNENDGEDEVCVLVASGEELVADPMTANSSSETKSSADSQSSTTTVTESATDGVVKVEVVTTTIPLEAAGPFMPKTSEQPAKSPAGPSEEEATKPQAAPPATMTSSFPPPDTSTQQWPSDFQPTRTPANTRPTNPQPTVANTPPRTFEDHYHQAHRKTKKQKGPLLTFPYPVACVFLYLVIGFAFNLWHPGWLLFFTIPIYYWIAEIIEKDPLYQLHRAQRKEYRLAQHGYVASQTSSTHAPHFHSSATQQPSTSPSSVSQADDPASPSFSNPNR